ncbi:hypothetical protein [Janthinobacterium sp. UMAB-60]|uniref:hypothetical protein n=1 Tax=Janthinobacterium sp. UMAB-60 TaxID=1365365 RepID=UPI001C5850E5|nr:hypothetical protein [Janthinobacterium sp. UMAB-60]
MHTPRTAKRPALDLFAEELRLAQMQLSSATDEFSPDDLLDVVFSRLCIRKQIHIDCGTAIACHVTVL